MQQEFAAGFVAGLGVVAAVLLVAAIVIGGAVALVWSYVRRIER